MRYTLLLHFPEIADQLTEEAREEGRAAFRSYAATLHQAGVLIAAEVLQPSAHTTTLIAAGGDIKIQDGPYADTKEQLGGTVVIEVPDLDAAIGYARQAPSVTWGPVEIRPGATHVVDGEWVRNR